MIITNNNIHNDNHEESKLYVIEVNPRSSRTIPFISKVTGIPMIKLAVQVMYGKKLSDLNFGTGLVEEKKLFAVKSPVFSMSKLSGVDTYLGPEMKSTGEVMGIDDNLPDAMKKAMIASGLEVDENTNFLLSIADRDKEDSLDFIKKLKSNGNKIYATEGTFNFLKSKGFDAIKVNKILSQSLEKTKDMEAKVGRAKFLEHKGVGFVDPGATSTEIILRAYFESVL